MSARPGRAGGGARVRERVRVRVFSRAPAPLCCAVYVCMYECVCVCVCVRQVSRAELDAALEAMVQRESDIAKMCQVYIYIYI